MYYVSDKFHVVQVEIADINNPSADGRCHYFDPSRLKTAIQSITKQRVMVSGVSGANLCSLSPCSPSPCQNGAKCSDVLGSYECSCRQGFTGVNCSTDRDECAQSE